MTPKPNSPGKIMTSLYRKITLLHTIVSFTDYERESLQKQFGKKRKWWKPAISCLPTMPLTLPNNEIVVSATFY